MNGKSDLDPSLCYPAVTIPDNNPVQILFYVAAKMIELELKTPEERRNVSVHLEESQFFVGQARELEKKNIFTYDFVEIVRMLYQYFG